MRGCSRWKPASETPSSSPGTIHFFCNGLVPFIEVDIMTDTFPDRLSVNPKSPYYDEALLARGVGIRFNGQEKTNVEEYCISEGWVKVAAGRALARRGNPITLTLKGVVVPYFHDSADKQD